MYSLVLFGSLRGFIEGGGWIFLWLGFIGALFNAIREHRKLWDEVKRTDGKKERAAICKMVFDWALVFVTLAGAIGAQLSSETADTRIGQQAAAITNATHQLTQAEVNIRELEQQMAQTSTNVVKIDPLNQPIASLTASVSLMNLGTNRTNIDPTKPLGGATIVKLRFGSSKHPENGWPAELVCVSCEKSMLIGAPTNKIPSVSDEPLGTAWLLEFGSSGMGHFISIIPPNATVRDANEWDVIEFDAFFLPSGTEIIGGDVILTINSTKRKFEIQPQKIQKAEEVETTEEQKKQGITFSFLSIVPDKPVTLISK